MAPGKGLEPLRARRPTGWLVVYLTPFGVYDLEASAITTPPPRHQPKGSRAHAFNFMLALQLVGSSLLLVVKSVETGIAIASFSSS